MSKSKNILILSIFSNLSTVIFHIFNFIEYDIQYLVVYIDVAVPVADCKWGDWGPCDQPCGGGVQIKTMDCCDCTPRVDIRSCNRHACPGQ